MSDEFVDPFVTHPNGDPATKGNPIECFGSPPDLTPDLLQAAGLVTASSLLDPDTDPDEGDFEPGNLYKGFKILPVNEWPEEPRHAHIEKRFYVRHNDLVGMVPWPGSMVVWPWEAAWKQDLHRTEVQSLLKEEKKEPKKR